MNHRRYTYLVGEDILLLKRRYTSFLKETHHLFMHGGMGALLLMLLLLTACVGEELQKPLLGEGEGYLTLQIGAISAEIQTAPLTKTTTQLDKNLIPAEENLTINIKDANGTTVQHYDKLSEINAPIVLQTGTYIVEAYHGENNDIQEKPYFYGRREVMIEALKNTKAEFTASLANAMITPVVSENLSKHYKDYSVTANVNGSTFEFPSGKSLFAAAERTISLTFTGTNQLGVETSYTSPETKPLQAGKNYLLQCDPKFSECSSIQVNATIDPIITKDGWLTGSNVSLSYSSPDGAQIDSISSWHVEVYYNDNGIDNIIRTYDSSSAPNSATTIMTPVENWPYVPKESKITAYVVIKGDKIPVEAHTTVNPIPSEVIEVKGTTSYDLYLAEDISGANGMDAGTIKGIGAKAKISEDLLSKFSHSFSLTYDNEEPSYGTSTITVGDKTGQSWGNHPITATMVFDGQRIEAKKDCHITGLPFVSNPPTTAYWSITKGDVKWEGDYARLGNWSWTNPHSIKSKSFHVTDDINVLMYVKADIYKAATGNTFTLSLGSNELIHEDSYSDRNSTKPIDTAMKTSVSTSANFIQCYNSWGSGNTHVKVYYVKIYYRQL